MNLDRIENVHRTIFYYKQYVICNYGIKINQF